MARLNVTGLDEVINDMARMQQMTGKVADAMILTGAAVLREKWQESAQEHGHVDTWAMHDSIYFPKEPKTINGMRMLDVYPQGKDEKGVRNAEKAFILHYGSSRIDASYWVDYADKIADQPAGMAMIRIWDEFIETGKIPQVERPKFKRNQRKQRF